MKPESMTKMLTALSDFALEANIEPKVIATLMKSIGPKNSAQRKAFERLVEVSDAAFADPEVQAEIAEHRRATAN